MFISTGHYYRAPSNEMTRHIVTLQVPLHPELLQDLRNKAAFFQELCPDPTCPYTNEKIVLFKFRMPEFTHYVAVVKNNKKTKKRFLAVFKMNDFSLVEKLKSFPYLNEHLVHVYSPAFGFNELTVVVKNKSVSCLIVFVHNLFLSSPEKAGV